MIEFGNGLKRYEWKYRDSMKDGYLREGNGKEYDVDVEDVIYEDHFLNGERQGQGKLYRTSEWYMMEYGWNDINRMVLIVIMI